MAKPRGSRAQVAIYLLFLFTFSSIFYFLMLRAHTLGGGGGLYVVGIMWCPALAAMATLKLNARSLNELGWNWPQSRYATMSWYVPLLYATITYAIVWISGTGGFPNHQTMQDLVTRMGLHTSPPVSTMLHAPCRVVKRHRLYLWIVAKEVATLVKRHRMRIHST